jgi:hypothetical protein
MVPNGTSKADFPRSLITQQHLGLSCSHIVLNREYSLHIVLNREYSLLSSAPLLVTIGQVEGF